MVLVGAGGLWWGGGVVGFLNKGSGLFTCVGILLETETWVMEVKENLICIVFFYFYITLFCTTIQLGCNPSTSKVQKANKCHCSAKYI